LPTYEYACTACGHRLEAVQKFSDASLTVCPECQGGLRKVYAPVGIVLKGSGFYKTDSRTNGNGKNGKKASQGAESSTGDSSSSGDGGSKSESSSSSSSDSGSKSDAGSKSETSKPAATTAG
jgi:putative FmdB family regulatory protein